MVLCAYGVDTKGQRELIDFQIAQEGENDWHGFLWGLWRVVCGAPSFNSS
jgi:transposase-like protein